MVTCGLACNSWDDPKGLIRLLESKNIDKLNGIIILEGRYIDYPDKPEHEPQIIEEIISQYQLGLNIFYHRIEGKKQIEKRNAYWKIAGELGYDFLLIIDSDEYIDLFDSDAFFKDLEELKDSGFHCFPVNCHNQVSYMPVPRLVYEPGKLQYKNRQNGMINHGEIFLGDKGIIEDFHKIRYEYWRNREHHYVNGLTMYHNKYIRTNNRTDLDEEYYKLVPNR